MVNCSAELPVRDFSVIAQAHSYSRMSSWQRFSSAENENSRAGGSCCDMVQVVTEQYDENKPLYGSRGIEVYLKLLRNRYPHVDIDELLLYAQMEPYQVADEAHLFSQKQINLFYEKIVAMTGNSNIAREAGRFGSSPEALGTLQGSMIGLLGPIRFFEISEKFCNKLTKSSLYQARKLAHNKVEITVTPYPGTIEQPYQCDNRLGWLDAVSVLYGLRQLKVEHPQCLFHGANVCHYIVSWKVSPAFILRRIRNIATVILGLACLVVFFRTSAANFAIALPVSVSIVLVLNWFARSLEIKDLRQAIEKMRDDSDKLVEQIEINYENSLLVNEIGQVLAKESVIEGLFVEVANVLQMRLDFDRGMVLLPNSRKTALLLQAGYGFAEAEHDTMKAISFDLENPPLKGLFTGVFLSQQPALFNSLEDAKKRLSEKTFELLKKMGTRSIISCPIIYEGESLGVLAVSNISNKRQLLQRDINLRGAAHRFIARSHHVELENLIPPNPENGGRRQPCRRGGPRLQQYPDDNPWLQPDDDHEADPRGPVVENGRQYPPCRPQGLRPYPAVAGVQPETGSRNEGNEPEYYS